MRLPLLVVSVLLSVILVAPPVAAAPSAREDAAAAALLQKINSARGNRTLGALTSNPTMDQQAYRHSKRMARRGVLSHQGFGNRATTINTATGYTTLCENVAYVSGSFSKQQVVRIVFRGWKRSPGHRDCMFHPNADRAGIGIKKAGRTWWATLIAADA